MPDFQLISDFKPTGDQPEAIEKLVDGLRRGYRHQTLLGVTGSGKSLGYGDPVFIVERCDEHSMAHLVTIGRLIDGLMEQAEANVRQEQDTQILDVDSGPVTYYAQAIDPTTCTVGLQPIQSFVRHAAPTTMYRLETACGRSVTLTGDHNLWVLRDGQLQLIKTSEARLTDHIPVPEQLLADDERDTLDILTTLADKRLFVYAGDAMLAYTSSHGPGLAAQALSEAGVASYAKLSAIRHNRRGKGIQINAFQHLLQRTNGLGGHWNAATAYVGGKAPANRLPALLDLTPEFLRLLGYYIAEGNHQRGYVILANRSEGVRRDIETALSQLGIPFSVRASSDYQISSTALANLLSELCGDRARDKHLPEFWPQLPKAALAHLLSAYFDGDGTVRASTIEATTASAQLASDLTYALLRFGIWARISRRWKRATNSQHPGDWYYYVTLSGQDNLRRFQQAIGFSLPHKQQALTTQLQHTVHSNVDLVPLSGPQLRWLRTQLGLTAQVLGKRGELSQTAIQLMETDKHSPQRANLRRLLTVLREEAACREALPSEWWSVWTKLWNLCQVRWTPITSVGPVEYQHPYVYDFCVPGVETFLAGTGGMFVHNTFTIANVIQQVQRPTLVMSHNKTLAAQLYSEFLDFFPHNAVEYFVSYYDYYQPEAYIPRTDTYIEKEATINDEIDRLRLAATRSLFERRDVIIVASVSCIFSLGSPEEYGQLVVRLRRGERHKLFKLLRHLVDIQYTRNDTDFGRGRFRVRGDTLDIFPSYDEIAIRVEFFGDEIERLTEVDPLTGEVLAERLRVDIYPARHFVTGQERLELAIADIEAELEERLAELHAQGKVLEAARLEQRTRFDLEMLRETGYCAGIENYARHLARRAPGSTPWTLLDYFPADWLLIVDESHMTIPQVRGMYHGDRSRKETLVEYGFRLPSALDNRPLNFAEFEQHLNQVIYTSATPGPYERERSAQIVEQVIRPTGLVDPSVEVKPTKGQIDDLLKQINARVKHGERVLVTTLTKRMAEDLADYLREMGVKVHYLHSEIETLERVDILRDLRLGVYDVVVGINLLREGLDLPEVSLVAILDADKEGFLRSEWSLIQTMGRAARHEAGHVIMYADTITDSMRRAIEETNRRREKQIAYNQAHGITPQSIVKEVRDLTARVRAVAEPRAEYQAGGPAIPKDELARLIKDLEKQMKEAAQALEFERAAVLRDQIIELRGLQAGEEGYKAVLADKEKRRRGSM